MDSTMLFLNYKKITQLFQVKIKTNLSLSAVASDIKYKRNEENILIFSAEHHSTFTAFKKYLKRRCMTA